MYTIKHAAEVTGLTPATLRAWERRYGVGTSHRTPAGYRLYDEGAVRALTLMASLVAQGWAPRQAAEETLRGRPAGLPAPGGHVSGRAQAATPAPAPAAEDLIGPAARMDPRALSAALDARFATTSFEAAVDGWLMPSLVALGQAWSEGRVSVAGEHLASHAVMRRLAAAYDAAASGATGPLVLIGLPPGVRHELGVLAFAVAARRSGLRTAYLGPDLPAAEWVTAVSDQRTDAVVLAALRDEDLAPLGAVVEALRARRPDLVVGVGGARQDGAPQGCLLLGHTITAGVRALTAALTPGAGPIWSGDGQP